MAEKVEKQSIGEPVEEEVTFSVDTNLVEQLSAVSNTPEKAILELVNNGYDADADKINLTFKYADLPGEQEYIEICDDGVGMSIAEVKEYYMRISQNRRSRPLQFTPKGRKPRGRRGIGRFAAFALADEVYLETVREGTKVTLKLKLSDIKKTKGDITDFIATIKKEAVDKKTSGTKIRLTKLFPKTPNPNLLQGLLTEHFFGEKNFVIYINKDRVNISTPPGEKVKIGNKIIKDVGTVTAELVILDKVNIKLAGVRIVVDGRPTDPRRTTWGDADNLPESVQRRIFGNIYIPHIEGVMDLQDNIIENDPRISMVIDWIGKEMAKIGEKLIPSYCNELAERMIAQPILKRELDRLPHSQRSLGRHVVMELVKRCPNRSESILNTLAVMAIRALFLPEMQSVLEALRDAKDDNIRELASLLEKRAIRELVIIGRLIDVRLVAVEKLTPLVNSQKTPEADIHRVVEKQPWLFGEEYSFYRSNRSLAVMLREKFDRELVAKGKLAKRPDLFFCDLEGRRLLIVEIKPPQESLSWEYYQQVNEYASLALEYCGDRPPSIETILVGSKLEKGLRDFLDNNKPQNSKVRVWADIFAESKLMLESIRDEIDKDREDDDTSAIAIELFKDRKENNVKQMALKNVR